MGVEPPGNMIAGVQAGDGFRNGFSNGIGALKVRAGLQQGNRTFSLRHSQLSDTSA